MRKIILASDRLKLHPEIIKLLGSVGSNSINPDDIHKWEENLRKKDEDVYEIYRKDLKNGLLVWREETQTSHDPNKRNWSVNAYRQGLMGKDVLIKVPCWVLRIASDKPQKQSEQESKDFLKLMKVTPRERDLYQRLRYAYKVNNTKMSDWEKTFCISIGEHLTDGKNLSMKQKEMVNKLFAKYKVPEDATASSELSHRQIMAWLAKNHDGLKVIYATSFGGGNRAHSIWHVEWSDGTSEQIHTDGTDGGSSKAYNKSKAIENAVKKKYKELI